MNEQAHWLARGHSYSEGEVPLYRLAEEIAESLTIARPATWSKDGSNNALRAEIAKAMQVIGCGDIVKGLLENFRELMRQSRTSSVRFGLRPRERGWPSSNSGQALQADEESLAELGLMAVAFQATALPVLRGLKIA